MSSSLARASIAALALVSLAAAHPAPAQAGPSVTIYSRDLGFVRETRTLDLGGERDTVRLTDVSERLDFSSVTLSPQGGARVARLAYRYDLASGDGAIDRARGGRVRVTLRGDRAVEGVLIASDPSWLVVRADDATLHTLARGSVDEVRVTEPAGGFSLRPTIEAVIEGAKRGRVPAELAYLTGGLSWSAEHTLVRKGETGGSWSSAVSVENTTGRDYRDAELKLVAGEPNRESAAPQPMVMRGMAMMEAKVSSAPDLSEQSFAEYHLYTLGRPATLRDRESQKLSMLEPHTITIAPRYLYRGGDARGVLTQLEIPNTKAAGLGVPLPGGRVRIYESDPSGDRQFIGETHINHTPEGEKMTLEVGVAFDLAAERHELYNKRISDREREISVEIKLRNRKKTDVTILVQESVGGDTEVTQKSQEFVRKDANTIEFTVPVAVGKEAVVRYVARVRY